MTINKYNPHYIKMPMGVCYNINERYREVRDEKNNQFGISFVNDGMSLWL